MNKRFEIPVFVFTSFLIGFVCLCFGSFFISPLELVSINPVEVIWRTPQDQLGWIVKLRLIRLATAFVVGAGLSVAGLAYQAVLRNPLAEPFILGVSGGAGLGAAIAISTGLAMVSCVAVPFGSFVGAVIVLGIVLLMARGAGVEYTSNVMLSGVIMGTVCSSVLMFIISVLGVETLHSVTWWMLGNLQPGETRLLLVVWSVVFLGVAVLVFLGREVNALSLGEEMAYYLGISPKTLVLIVLGLASLMTASVVSLAGIIGFVGLIVPHSLRRVFGADHRRLFPLAFWAGGSFLMICDTVARSALGSQEIPVGVITALIGGPFFLWLLNKKARTI